MPTSRSPRPVTCAAVLAAIIVGCSDPPRGEAGSATDTIWTGPATATSTHSLDSDGTLTWRGRRLSPPLPTRTRDGTSSPVEYSVSPPSPSGRWALVQGRGPTFSEVWIVDAERGMVRETPATKYGIERWVAWAPALPYAIVSNHVEATALLYRVDLESGEARQIEFGLLLPSPLSATPIESTLRWVDDAGGAFSIDARVACNTAVERCEGAPPSETRTFHVDLRTLRVSEP